MVRAKLQKSNEIKVLNQEEQAEFLQEQSWTKEYPSLGLRLECALNTDEGKIRENIRENLKRGHDQIWPYKAQDTEVCICAGGPSLKENLEDIKERQFQGAKVVALANTAHVLVNAGIRPNAHILLDAKPRNATFILPNVETTYFIASQCDPEVFEVAEKTKNKIFIWHGANNPEEFEVLNETGEPWIPVQGGSTLTVRAIRLFNILGYSNFHVYGFDSCYLDGKHHSYEQPDADKHKRLKLHFEGRDFTVSPWMIAQFMEFQDFVKAFGMNINLKVHGDGLVSHLIERGAKSTVNIEE